MANTLTPQDVYQIVNEMAAQALGGKAIAAVDTSSFVTVGEMLLRTGTENTLNALSTVIGKTIFSTRPYRSKFQSLVVNAQRWGGQVRKITYLWNDAEASQDWNTQLSPQALQNGNSIDMYKINAPEALQLNFYGTKVLQKHITRFRDQLALAFTSEQEFISFIDGVMVEFNNEIEIINEQKSRGAVLNFMAGMQAMNLNVVDLIEGYNDLMGTTYTREQLLSTHISDFMKYMAAQVKVWSAKLTDMNFNYHANITGKKKIPRHTPKQRQKMLMYEPLFIQAESRVYSSLFNPDYLNIGDFEGVNYWQDSQNPESINITPNILDVATGNSVNAANAVSIPYVLGLLYDEEALGVMPQFDYASTTPFNSAGGYYNMFMHWRFNVYNDFTENAVLFILGDGDGGQVDTTDVNIYSYGTTAKPVNNTIPVELSSGRGTEVSSPVYISGTVNNGSGSSSSNPIYTTPATQNNADMIEMDDMAETVTVKRSAKK